MGKTKTGKGKKSGKKQAKKRAKKGAKAKTSRARSQKSKKNVDMVQVRESISNLVGESAPKIVEGLIAVAKTGALNQVRYAFEVAGLYPATEATTETKEPTEEESFAKVLLERLGDVVTPKIEGEEKCEEDEALSATNEPAQGEERTPGAKAPLQETGESQR